MTNFERIKEMSVDEIAGFLNDISTSLAIKVNSEYIVREKESVKQWLNSEITP